MINILHITPDFNYCCGRSKLVYLYLKYFSEHPDFEIHLITNGGDSLDRLNDLPKLKYQKLKFSTGLKNIIYIKRFYNELKDYIIKNNIDIIHTHHRFPEMNAVRIGKKRNLRTVFSTHGFVYGNKKISFQSDKIISVSNSVTNHLIENFNVPKEKIITIYNPVEDDIKVNPKKVENFLKENKINLKDQVILFVGRLNKDKGFDILLKSFELVTSKRNNLFLIINAKLETKVNGFDSLSKNKKIIFVPPQEDINHLFGIAEMVILPSRSDSFPFVMIEAGSFRKPFIGGNTGGIAEFIEDGKNGLLVEPGNSEQLSEKILYILDNPDLAKVMGENLFLKVNKLCNYNRYFSEIEKIYYSLLPS